MTCKEHLFNFVRLITEVTDMSTSFAIVTLIEFFACILLIYGFIHEDKVIAFEQAVKRIIIGNIRRAVRIKNRKKQIARGEHLRLHNNGKKIVNVDFTVA